MNAALLALFATAFLWPALASGEMPIFRDFVNTFLPYKLYAARAFASGHVPLWAPEPSLGAPFLANYQSGVLYPFSTIVYLWPSPFGVGLYLWLHFWVGAVGMSVLLARRGCSRVAQLFGAVVYVFGGCFVTAAQWSHLTALAWLPFTLAAVERLGDRATAARFAALTLLFAIVALGGSPEGFAELAALAFVVALVAPSVLSRPRRVFLPATAILLALAIAAVQLLPTLEYYAESERAVGLSRDLVLTDSLDPAALATLVFPRRLDGGVVTADGGVELGLFWSIYVGIAPLLLVVVALVRREAWVWTAVLAVSLVFAMGGNTPIYPFLHDVLPRVFASFRYPEKFLLASHFAIAMLAALGFARIEAAAAGRGRAARLLLASLLCGITVLDLFDVHRPAMLFSDWRSIVESAPPPPLRGEGASARVFGYEPTEARGLRPWSPRFAIGANLEDVMRYTWSEIAANVGLVYGIGFVNGFDSLLRRPLVELRTELAAGPLGRDRRLLAAFGARFWMGERPLEEPGLELVREGGQGRTWIYRAERPAPRVYLATSSRHAAGTRAALAIVGGADFRPGEDAVIDRPTPFEPRTLAGGSAEVVEEEAERVVIDLESDGDGLLVLNDSFYPGWRAEIDERPAEVLMANALVRAVEVPPGRHRVSFAYEPRSFRVGCWISLAALLALWPLARAVTPRGK